MGEGRNDGDFICVLSKTVVSKRWSVREPSFLCLFWKNSGPGTSDEHLHDGPSDDKLRVYTRQLWREEESGRNEKLLRHRPGKGIYFYDRWFNVSTEVVPSPTPKIPEACVWGFGGPRV